MYNKVFDVLIVDDDDEVNSMFEVVKNELKCEGYEVNFEYMHYIDSKNKNTEKFELKVPYDIVVFDCTFNASDFMKFREGDEPVGYSLIKQFREINRNTKVILYSGVFDLENEQVPFTRKDLINIINEVNIFRILEKDVTALIKSIKEAINDLDMVMVCTEDIYRDYMDEEVTYEIGGKEIAIQELIKQFKMGGIEAEKFKQDVTRSIIKFLMKFKY